MALIEIATFPDLMMAEIVRGRLEAEGIDAMVFDAGLSGLGLGTMAPARLMVDEDDVAQAQQILSEADSFEAD